jgi:hypothetical protein
MCGGASVLSAALFLLFTLAAGSANATTIEATLTPFTADDPSVRIVLDDAAGDPGEIEVRVEVIGNDADLRGVFFNLALDDALLFGLVATGDDVTDFMSGDLIDLGFGGNLYGVGSPCLCDFGVALGTSGIGEDVLRSVTFTLTLFDDAGALVALDLGMFAEQTVGVRLGARLASDGIHGRGRQGSSKLSGTFSPIPEPTTGLLFGSGLAGLAFMGRRRRR